MMRTGGLCLLLVLLSACRSAAPPDNFYLLTANSPAGGSPGPEVSVGVGPVQIPEYLRRSEIAWFMDGNNLVVDSAERWAEPLDIAITRVVAANLARLDGGRTLTLYPWRQDEAPDYALRLDIRGLNRGGAGQAALEAVWRLIDNRSGEILERGVFNSTEAVGAFSYAALVAAWSDLLADLSRELSAALNRQAGRPTPG